jgi:hypothetical protein
VSVKTVVRPAGEHSSAVQVFLRHLEAQGFTGAPWVISASRTEELLSFIEGAVPAPPEPPDDGWPIVSDARAASVADLLARLDAIAHSFVPYPDARWNAGFSPAVEQVMVCQNDVLGNVLFVGNTPSVGSTWTSRAWTILCEIRPSRYSPAHLWPAPST